jgi:hypothetical protein
MTQTNSAAWPKGTPVVGQRVERSCVVGDGRIELFTAISGGITSADLALLRPSPPSPMVPGPANDPFKFASTLGIDHTHMA